MPHETQALVPSSAYPGTQDLHVVNDVQMEQALGQRVHVLVV